MRLEFSVNGGINRDIPSHQLPEGAWSSGQNVRFKDGQVFKFAGHSSELTTTAVPYYLLPVPGTTTYWIICGLNDVYAWDGTTEKEITRASGGDYSATADRNWTGGIIQGVPFVNNGVDTPQFWDKDFSTPGKLAEVTAWPSGYTAGTIRAFQDHMIALDVTKSGTRYPNLVLWSHAAEPNSLPSTWDITDTTALAGEIAIATTGGVDGESEDTLLDCAGLRNALYVYSAGQTFRMQKIGAPLVFRFDRPVFTEVGLLSRRCLSSFANGHFVVSSHDIVVHNGTEPESIIDSRTRRHIFNNIDSDNFERSFVVRHNFLKEMWFCYPEAGKTFPNKAMIWNWRENSIGFRDLPDVAHIAGGQVASTVGTTWDSNSDSWNQQRRSWNSLGYSPTAPRLLQAAQSQDLFVADNTNSFDGTAFTSFIRREALPLGVRGNEKYVDLDNRYIIKNIYPKVTGTGQMTFKILSQEEPGGTATEHSFTFNPATDYKIDCLVEGRLLGIEASSNTAIDWQLQSFDLEVDRVGSY